MIAGLRAAHPRPFPLRRALLPGIGDAAMTPVRTESTMRMSDGDADIEPC